MEFDDFLRVFTANAVKMQEKGHLVEVEFDKDKLWSLYLESIPAEKNKMFRKQREYDCSFCRHFIHTYGGVLSIGDDLSITSLWDLAFDDDTFGPSMKAMSAYIHSLTVTQVFVTAKEFFGTAKDMEMIDEVPHEWKHLYVAWDKQYVQKKEMLASIRGESYTKFDVLKRAFTELSSEALETVLELIAQNSLYRGAEFEGILSDFRDAQEEYELIAEEKKEAFVWGHYADYYTGLRNTAIGTLLVGLSEGRDLTEAVTAYEKMVAPTNYKRPKALVTPRMLKDAEDKIKEMGLMEALPRRFAHMEDITVNNVLFADRDAKKRMGTGRYCFGYRGDVMSYFVIRNDGEVEKEAFTLMGASSKEGDDSKIGFFGSGNKYALAILMRQGVSVRIFSGMKEIKVGKRDVTFRGQNFTEITIDGQPTGITTRTGPAWELWMALREFCCNALDEGGASWNTQSFLPAPVAGTTQIVIESTPEISTITEHFDRYLIPEDVVPLYTLTFSEGSTFGHLFKGNDGRVYRKGVLCVPEDSLRKSLFRYDFDSLDIDESRVANMYDIYGAVARALSRAPSEDVIKKYISAAFDTEYLEAEANWCSWMVDSFSDSWRTALLSYQMPCVSDSLYAYLPKEDHMSCLKLPDHLAEKLHVQFPDIPFIGSLREKAVPAEAGKEVKDILQYALKELQRVGIPFSLPVQFVNFTGSSTTLAMCTEEGACLLRADYTWTLEEMLYALMEEQGHRDSGCSDGSRGFVDYFQKQWYISARDKTDRVAQLEKDLQGAEKQNAALKDQLQASDDRRDFLYTWLARIEKQVCRGIFHWPAVKKLIVSFREHENNLCKGDK